MDCTRCKTKDCGFNQLLGHLHKVNIVKYDDDDDDDDDDADVDACDDGGDILAIQDDEVAGSCDGLVFVVQTGDEVHLMPFRTWR